MKRFAFMFVVLAAILTTIFILTFSQAADQKEPPPPDRVTKVSELPLQFQYTDEEWRDLIQKFKITPDIEVNPRKSEVLTCNNCAIILNGHLLYPPFYFQRKNDHVYLNGFQIYPFKITQVPRPAAFKKERSRLFALKNINSNIESNKYCEDKTRELDNEIISILDSSKFIDQKRIEVKNVLSSKGGELVALDIRDKGAFSISYYPGTGCPISDFSCEGEYGTFNSNSMVKVPSLQLPYANMHDEIKIFCSDAIQDNIVFVPFGNWGYSSFTFNQLNNIILLITNNSIDERIIFYKLNRYIHNYEYSFCIMANKVMFYDEYRSGK